MQNQALEGEGSTIPTEPPPTPFTLQLNISATQTAPLQTATHPTVSHELQTEAHIKQILSSPSTYQRKHKKTYKPKKSKKVTKLPQTSVPLDIGANEAIHQEEGDSVERAITTNASLVAAQDNAQTRFKTAYKWFNDPPLSTGYTVKSREDRMEREIDLIDFVPPTPHDSPLSGGHTPRSDEGAQKERQKQEEATIAALTEEFDDIQARMDADHEPVVRMTHEEQKMCIIEERARLLAEYFERRKKQLAVERAEAIRNKPSTRT
nr:hypothetical protein [Tanacetum cinerariifolium]